MSDARLSRKPYPTDVSDDEWAFVAPYLTLVREDAPQRKYELREVFNGLRWIVRAGAPWRLLPTNLPPWEVVYQQAQRWIAAGCFEAMVHDLREILRLAVGREPTPSAVILDSRTLQSTPESGGRAGYDGAQKRKGSKVHLAVDCAHGAVGAHFDALFGDLPLKIDRLCFPPDGNFPSHEPNPLKDENVRDLVASMKASGR